MFYYPGPQIFSASHCIHCEALGMGSPRHNFQHCFTLALKCTWVHLPYGKLAMEFPPFLIGNTSSNGPFSSQLC